MVTLYGKYIYVLAGKNRLVIPPMFRERLREEGGRHFIVSCGPDRCLCLFLPSQWAEAAREEKFLSDDKEKARALRRFLFSSAFEAEPDAQGRILLNRSHIDFAGIKKNAVVCGAGHKAEIWAEEVWNEYEARNIRSNLKDFGKTFDL